MRLTEQDMFAHLSDIGPVAHHLEIPRAVHGVAIHHRAAQLVVAQHQFLVHATCRILQQQLFIPLNRVEVPRQQVDAGDLELGGNRGAFVAHPAVTSRWFAATLACSNIQRANMSPTEEAAAAARILGRCEGNRDEAANRLGWTRKTLDKRLALMNCSLSVMTALNERKIQLGHAELLAATPKDRQEKVIANLLSRPSLPTVAIFKAGLEEISQAMSLAIFDKTDCASCHHNSGNQQALFAEAVSAGHCTNSECFNKKTEDVLEAKKKSLAENYPCVVIVRPGENNTVIKLVAEGATGVGAEQAAACRSCKSYGAAISAVPGKVGNVYESQCFDSSCHTRKVGEHLLAEKKSAENPTTVPTTAKSADLKVVTGKGAEKSTTTPKSAMTSVQDTQRVVEYRIGIWRKALKKELFADPHKNLCMNLSISGRCDFSMLSVIEITIPDSI